MAAPPPPLMVAGRRVMASRSGGRSGRLCGFGSRRRQLCCFVLQQRPDGGLCWCRRYIPPWSRLCHRWDLGLQIRRCGTLRLRAWTEPSLMRLLRWWCDCGGSSVVVASAWHWRCTCQWVGGPVAQRCFHLRRLREDVEVRCSGHKLAWLLPASRTRLPRASFSLLGVIVELSSFFAPSGRVFG